MKFCSAILGLVLTSTILGAPITLQRRGGNALLELLEFQANLVLQAMERAPQVSNVLSEIEQAAMKTPEIEVLSARMPLRVKYRLLELAGMYPQAGVLPGYVLSDFSRMTELDQERTLESIIAGPLTDEQSSILAKSNKAFLSSDSRATIFEAMYPDDQAKLISILFAAPLIDEQISTIVSYVEQRIPNESVQLSNSQIRLIQRLPDSFRQILLKIRLYADRTGKIPGFN